MSPKTICLSSYTLIGIRGPAGFPAVVGVDVVSGIEFLRDVIFDKLVAVLAISVVSTRWAPSLIAAPDSDPADTVDTIIWSTSSSFSSPCNSSGVDIEDLPDVRLFWSPNATSLLFETRALELGFDEIDSAAYRANSYFLPFPRWGANWGSELPILPANAHGVPETPSRDFTEGSPSPHQPFV